MIGALICGAIIGSALSGGRSSSGSSYSHSHTVIINPIKYPDDWQDYDHNKKLAWLKARNYTREYNREVLAEKRRQSMPHFVDVAIDEREYNIPMKVLDAFLKGDSSKAKEIVDNYLNFLYFEKKASKDYIEKALNQINVYLSQHKFDLMKNGCRTVTFNIE